MLGACETVDAVTGKDKLELDLERARAQSRARIAELEVQNRTLAKEARDLRARLDALEPQLAAAQQELETLRAERSTAAGRINVLLFSGDIVYAVVPTAFADYRAGIRLHSLDDAEFAAALKLFEQREGGDAALLRILRKIDTDNDRIISVEEAHRFREQRESSLKTAAGKSRK